MNAALQHGRFAILHAGAFGVCRVNKKHAARVARDQGFDVVYPLLLLRRSRLPTSSSLSSLAAASVSSSASADTIGSGAR